MKKVVLIVLFVTSFLFANQDEQLRDAFEKAKAMLNKDDFESVFTQLAEKFPEHLYGQKAFLELGKISLLERNYQEAIGFFKQIYKKEIEDKEYWLAKAYFQAGEYHHAILSAQNYIFDSKKREYIEESYFIISEAYIMQKLYQRALNTLDFLRQSQYINDHIPLLYYQMIVCHLQRKEYDTAHTVFSKLKADFPYDEYTFRAEEEIYQTTVSGDVPDSPSQPIATSQSGSSQQTYLQVGAFSTLASANNQKKEINRLGLEGMTFQKKSNGKILFVAAAGPFSDDEQLQKGKAILERNQISYLVIRR